MVLEFLGQTVSEADLARLLGTRAFGTPAPNLPDWIRPSLRRYPSQPVERLMAQILAIQLTI